jgi:hypothetical protein
VSIQVVLKNDGSGCGIKAILSFFPIALTERQPALGFAAGQALVLAHNRHPHPRSQRVNESDRVRGLIRRRTVEARRYAYDNLGHTGFLSCKTRHLDQNTLEYGLIGVVVAYSERFQGSSERSRRIADRQSNPAPAEVDGEHSHFCLICRCYKFAPKYDL